MRIISDVPYIVHNIELTNNCIMKCVMCPRTTSMTRPKGFMPENVFETVIEQYIKDNKNIPSHVWLHHFGESLLHPKVADYVQYMQKRGVKAGISINPVALSPQKTEELLRANPHILYLSIDGFNEATFSSIRGVQGAWEQTRENALHFLKMKSRQKSTTKAIISAINFPQFPDLVRLSRNFWSSQPGVDDFLEKPFTDFNGEVREITELHGGVSYTRCAKPWTCITVAWDGRVLPCCFDYDAQYVLGDVNHASLKDIFNGEPMQKLRKQFINKNVTCALCINCSLGGKWSRSCDS